MLNIFKKKSENTVSFLANKEITPEVFSAEMSAKKSNELNKTRHYPPSIQEWSNSIYAYNKNLIKSLPVTDNLVNKILKSYFNLSLFHEKIKNKSRRLRIRFRRFTVNRIFLSRAEMKHTNNKVIITVYTYNRNLKYLYNRIRNLLSIIKRKKINKIWKKRRFYDYHVFFSLPRKLKLIRKKTLNLINKVKKEKRIILKNHLKNFSGKKKKIFFSCLFKNYKKQIYVNLIKKFLKKEILYLKYNQMWLLHDYKIKTRFMLGLNSIIQKIYKKKVEFNIVNLKYLHLNSNMFSESISLKLRKRKNRLLKVLKRALKLVKLPKFKKDISYVNNGSPLNKDETLNINSDILSLAQTNILENNVLNSLKHKTINGVRLEATGRLTKRLTASRSIFKLKYIGSMKNIDSSYKNLSSVMLRGHAKSNIQYTKLNSKTRNGAFGLKSWISSY